jgi:UPF0271 protein
MDLNADLGEGYGVWTLADDEALLDIVTSANVACGFHAGDPLTLDRTVAAAVRHGVVVGAQVSYPDLSGFGRREMELAPADLTACVLYQLGALDGFARAAGTRVRYVKPHGALYHRAARDRNQAAALVSAITRYDRELALVTLPNSALASVAADSGITVVAEGFADRSYTAEGGLVARGQPGAVLSDPAVAAAQAVELCRQAKVGSICVHSDTPGAAAIARAVRDALEAAGYALAPFAA